jgi:phage gpG-like protein
MATKRHAVTIKQDQVGKLVLNVRSLTKQELYVGIPESTAARAPDNPSDPRPPMNNAAIAYIQNFGSPTQGIPARPFMTMGVADAKPIIVETMKKIGGLAADGNVEGAMAGFNALGLQVVSAVRKRMTDGPWFPLSPRTIKARQRARKNGQAGLSPLIDTGRLRQAITYVLRGR